MKLDAKNAAALDLPRYKSDHIVFDQDLVGFGLRLRLSRGRLRKSWIAQYRANGRTRRVKLGPIEKLGPAQAREAARKILARAALGHDPQGEKKAKRQQAARTFRSVADAYLAARAGQLRPESLRIAKLYLTGSYFRPLHSIGIGEIAHPDIAARLSAITRVHSANTAAAARRAVSALFRWAVEEGWTTANPVIGTRKPARPTSRDRVLTDAELVAIWRACGDDDFGRIVKLLVLLAARPQEIGGMCWSELDLDGAETWTLPARRSKNRHSHVTYLPAQAVAIVSSVPQTSRDHLFGDRAGKGFTSWSRAKMTFDQCLAGKVRPWQLRDLRRSVATKLADLGVEPWHIEELLNHRSGRAGVAGVYNKSRYERAVKAALVQWSEHVLALVEGRTSNVVALRT